MQTFKVAVIDDDTSLVYGIVDQIKQADHFNIVGYAHDGLEGIQLIESQKPDIVILDMIMPKADGLAVLEHFQSQDINFLVLSAIGHDLVTRRAVSLGAVYYMVKPFEYIDLIDRMNTLFLGTSPKKKMVDTQLHYEDFIHNELSMLAVPVHIKGYHYIKEALNVILNHRSDDIKITKTVYPRIADTYDTTASSVERAIRSAVEATYQRNESIVREYFKKELFNNKITNKEFLLRIASQIKKQV